MMETERSGGESRCRHRWPPVCATVVLLGLLPALALGQAAGVPAGFEIDGTQICGDNGGDDWADGPGCAGQVDPPAPYTGAQFADCNWGNQGDGDDSTQFKGNSNKNDDLIGEGQSPWNWASQGGGPQKNDLTNVYVHRRTYAGDEWLFVGAETRSTNGDSHVDFEINQAGVVLQGANLAEGCVSGQACCDLNPDEEGKIIGNGPAGGRTIGDLIVSMDFIQGGVEPMMTVRSWDGAQYNVVNGVAGIDIFSQTNLVDIADGQTWTGFEGDGSPNPTTVRALQFVEGGFNLTKMGVTLDPCDTDATLLVKSRSSQSFTAELKDFALFPFPVPPLPVCETADVAVCDGDDATLCATVSGLDATGPFTLIWRDPSGEPVKTCDNMSDGDQCCYDVPGANESVAGIHTAEVTDARACTAETCEAELIINPEPTVNPDAVSECLDATDPVVRANEAGGTGILLCAWAGPGAAFLNDVNSCGPTFDLSAAGVGTHDLSVTVTDVNSCGTSGNTTVTVFPVPAVDPDSPVECIDAFDPVVSANESGGTGTRTCSWTGAAAAYLSDSASCDPTFDLSAAGPGMHNLTVTVTDENDCNTTGTTTVTVNDLPSCSLNGLDLTNMGVLTGTVSGGSGTYASCSASVNSTGWAIDSCTIDGDMITVNYTITQPADADAGFTVTVTDSEGCDNECSVQVSVPSECTIDPVDPICDGDPQTFCATFEDGFEPAEISWTGPGGPIPDSTCSGLSQGDECCVTVPGAAAGTYTAIVTDAARYANDTCAVDQVVDPIPECAIDVDSGDRVCLGFPATLTATNPSGTGIAEAAWTGPEDFTSELLTITVDAPGEYCLVIIDSNGCMSEPCCVTLDECAPCRMTGGSNDGQIPPKGYADGDGGTPNAQVWTTGGQVGAPSLANPGPWGEWTHREHGKDVERFTFHAGTASAPSTTHIDFVQCFDPCNCDPARPAPAKQLDFSGIGAIKNGSLNGHGKDTLMAFYVHVEDLGEPGNQNQTNDDDSTTCPALGQNGDPADCDCADYYHIRIWDNLDMSGDPVYEAYGYIHGGNFQIHPPVGETYDGSDCP